MVPAILAEQRLHCYLSLRLKAQSQVKSTWWQKALLAVGSICVGLLLAEGLVRLMHLAPRVERIAPGMEETPYRLCDNPILGYVYKENFRGHGSKELPVTYINAMGFADREHEISKPEGCRRIIVLGDSVAARGMPQALEGMLKARNVEVFNFAVNGYCTRAEVELLKERGLQLKADLVVVVFVHNDYLNINADLGWAADKLPAPVKAAFVHSHLFRILSLRLN